MRNIQASGIGGYISLLNGLFICMARLAKTVHEKALIVVPLNYHLMVLYNEPWQLEPSSSKTVARRWLCLPLGHDFGWIKTLRIFQVSQFLMTTCSTSKLSSDGYEQHALAITAEQLQDRCMEINVSPINQDDLRWGIHRPLGLVGIFLCYTVSASVSPAWSK